MHWHIREGIVGSTYPQTYFLRETPEQMLVNHSKVCDCGLFSIVECDDLMCLVLEMA